MLKDAGVGKQGHSRSATDSTRALLHVAVLQEQHGFSFDAAIKTTAAAELASPCTLRSAAHRFTAAGMLSEPDTSQRGRGNPLHPLHSGNTEEYGPSLKAEQLMHELIHKQKTEGISITSTIITAELRKQLGIAADRAAVGAGEAVRGRSLDSWTLVDRGAPADRGGLRSGHEDVLQQHRQALPRLDRSLPADRCCRGSAAVRHAGGSHQVPSAAQSCFHKHRCCCAHADRSSSGRCCSCHRPSCSHSAPAPLILPFAACPSLSRPPHRH